MQGKDLIFLHISTFMHLRMGLSGNHYKNEVSLFRAMPVTFLGQMMLRFYIVWNIKVIYIYT